MSMSQTVPVVLGSRSYDIVIGSGLLDMAGPKIAAAARSKTVSIITDTTVGALYLDRLTASLTAAGLTIRTVIAVDPGEGAKSFAGFESVMNQLLADRAERRDMLIALGGGVVGDLTGFAAATLLRGVDFVQIPTTLLAQVDSSVGGKTGINTSYGKNLVGAFYQPKLVLADMDVLSTLNRRDLLAGYAEVIKYGLIDDADFFARLEAQGADMLAAMDTDALTDVVAYCCRAKARIVSEDEREGGRRALLNLGHTFGHALEAVAGYDGSLLHGEGVALGMVMALDCHARRTHGDMTGRGRLIAHLDAVGLPARPGQVQLSNRQGFDTDGVIDAMAGDKKVEDGNMVFILGDIGTAAIIRDVHSADIRATVDASLKGYAA